MTAHSESSSGNNKRTDYYRTNIEHILDELSRIDLLVNHHIRNWRKNSKNIDFPGLYISEEEVDAILSKKKPVLPELPEVEEAKRKIAEKKKASLQRGIPLRLEMLRELIDLNEFEIEAVLIVLAWK